MTDFVDDDVSPRIVANFVHNDGVAGAVSNFINNDVEGSVSAD